LPVVDVGSRNLLGCAMDGNMQGPADAPVPKMIRFSTADFPEGKRLEAYRDIFGATIHKHDVEPLGERPFHFEADMLSLPGLGLASSSFSPCRRWIRTQHIDSDDFMVGIGLAGECILRQRGREAAIGVGEAVVTSGAHPAEVVIGVPSRAISLRISNAILKSRLPDIDDLASRAIPGNAESLMLLRGYVAAIRGTELIGPELQRLVVEHVHDLVLLSLGAKGDAREIAEERGGRAARRLAILREIGYRSGDPNFSALIVARELGVTPRYVHLLLEETGKSFTHHVLERRLEKAAGLLRDFRLRHRKIADIAVEAGFTDLSYFNRVFRRHFGATPSDIRQAAKHHV
jgi:AraC-like DNA-binding protein